ncbi:MAG: ABC transporter permease subunit [Crocinitomicaceae bacterium]|jgi:sodium transport system permease protein|nr:ABC transporter permease subunit [Crocinitomicaceae bacterium]
MIKRIFLKELKDTLRDRRTLLFMIVIPTLLFPVLLNLVMNISQSFQEEAAEKKLKIGFVGDPQTIVIEGLLNMPNELGNKELIPYASKDKLLADVKIDSIQMGVFISNEAIKHENEFKPSTCEVYYAATDVGISERAKTYFNYIEENAKQKRYRDLELDAQKLAPLEISYNNTASDKEMIGKLAGGILPYIFIAFGFIGCMYPAIDLFTGEKERGTIETLLTTPAARWQLLCGKMGVVVLSGLVASSCALLGLYVSIRYLGIEIDPKIMEVVNSVLTPGFVVSLLILLLPLVIFFAGVMVPISIYAKSFKEAQSIITPLNIVMVLPAMIGLFPGIELNMTTACIPVINVVLATKEMIAGTLDPVLMTISFSVMLLLAIIAVLVSYRHFDKETNVVL